MPKYPQIKVQLTGLDGNAFAILGRCQRAAKPHLTKESWEQFKKEAISSNYDHLLGVCMEWFDCA